MKNAMEWAELLPEPHRSNMINGINNKVTQYPTIRDAIVAAIKWVHTEQGTFYWADLYRDAESLIKQKEQDMTFTDFANFKPASYWLNMLPNVYKAKALKLAHNSKSLNDRYESLLDTLKGVSTIAECEFWDPLIEAESKGEFSKISLPVLIGSPGSGKGQASNGAKAEEHPITHWLSTLKEPYKSQALENFKAQKKEDILTHDFTLALGKAFQWTDSPQGYEYWAKINFKSKQYITPNLKWKSLTWGNLPPYKTLIMLKKGDVMALYRFSWVKYGHIAWLKPINKELKLPIPAYPSMFKIEDVSKIEAEYALLK